MKQLVIILVLGALGYVGWEHFQGMKPAVDGIPASLGDRASQPISQPVPAPSDAPHSEKAPEGIFFLLEKQTIAINDGLKGFSRGTQVQQVEDRGNVVLVESGTWQFDVAKNDLTNDATIAEGLRSADQRVQHEAYVRSRAALAAANARKEREWKEHAERVEAAQRPVCQSDFLVRQAVITQSNPLQRKAYNQRSVVDRRSLSSSPTIGSSPSEWYEKIKAQNQFDTLKRAQIASIESQIELLKKRDPVTGRYGETVRDQAERFKLQDQVNRLRSSSN